MSRPMNLRRLGLARLFAGGLAVLLFTPLAQAVEIKEVESPKGISAWLMEDPTDPMITISFSFEGGNLQDPEGKEGLTSLMVELLGTGAGDLERDVFEERLYATGARASISSGSEWVSGSVSVLPGEEEEPLELLSLVLSAPRFDQKDIDQTKGVILAALEDEKNNPDRLGWEKFDREFYGEHPLAAVTTPQSIEAITRDDLDARRKALFARSNLTVGAAGNIDQEEFERILDKVFGGLPAEPETESPSVPSLEFGVTVHQAYARPQTSITLVYPGLPSVSKDLYAANVLTNLLGGGMTSRLFHELREKRGLTYGAGASNAFSREWGIVYVSTSTRAESAQDALEMTKQIMRQAAEGEITQKEVDDAKAYLKGSVALGALDSTSQIANTLVNLQRLKRPIDYLDRLDGLYDAVTLEDVKNIAARLLSTEPAVLIVGDENG